MLRPVKLWDSQWTGVNLQQGVELEGDLYPGLL